MNTVTHTHTYIYINHNNLHLHVNSAINEMYVKHKRYVMLVR